MLIILFELLGVQRTVQHVSTQFLGAKLLML